MLFNYLKLIRIHQWVKNVFVFVPLLFSHNLFEKEYFLTTLFAFFVFSLASSAIAVVRAKSKGVSKMRSFEERSWKIENALQLNFAEKSLWDWRNERNNEGNFKFEQN